VFVATNFLESMIKNNYPNRGEVNDIYSTLEMGAAGLVLAAETAVGKHPLESVKLLQTIIKTFKKDTF
jgi:pyruvate kinase